MTPAVSRLTGPTTNLGTRHVQFQATSTSSSTSTTGHKRRAAAVSAESSIVAARLSDHQTKKLITQASRNRSAEVESGDADVDLVSDGDDELVIEGPDTEYLEQASADAETGFDGDSEVEIVSPTSSSAATPASTRSGAAQPVATAKTDSYPTIPAPLLAPREFVEPTALDQFADKFIKHCLPPENLRFLVSQPVRPHKPSRMKAVFRRITNPYRLRKCRGSSSTVPYTDFGRRQFQVVAGIAVQLTTGQALFYPNYEVVKLKSREVMARYGPAGHDQFDELLDEAPWDEMWFDRVLLIFMINPSELAEEHYTYWELVWTFMYQFRKEIWVRAHWLPLSRDHTTPQLKLRYDERMAADKTMMEVWRKLYVGAPAGLKQLMWSEPAFWFVPDRPCTWVIRPTYQVSLVDQLDDLDTLEPIRCNWAQNPERFVEALLAEQVKLLDSRGGFCWELPAPWSNPQYLPPHNLAWPVGGAQAASARSSPPTETADDLI